MFRLATAFLAIFVAFAPTIASAEDGRGRGGEKPRPAAGDKNRERGDKGEKGDKETRHAKAREWMKKHHKGRKGMRRHHRRDHHRHAQHARRHAGRGKK